MSVYRVKKRKQNGTKWSILDSFFEEDDDTTEYHTEGGCHDADNLIEHSSLATAACLLILVVRFRANVVFHIGKETRADNHDPDRTPHQAMPTCTNHIHVEKAEDKSDDGRCSDGDEDGCASEVGHDPRSEALHAVHAVHDDLRVIVQRRVRADSRQQ